MRMYLASLLSFLGVAAAHADVIVYTSTSRSITADSSGGALTDSTSLAGPWSSDRFSYNPLEDPPVSNPSSTALEGGGGYATQASNFGPDTITAQLSAKAWDGRSGFGGSASSIMSGQFTLASAVLCHLTGLWETDYTGIGGVQLQGSLSLVGPTGTVYTGGYSFPLNFGSLAFDGVLPPGAYMLTATASYQFASLGTIAGAQHMRVEYSLAVPSPAATPVCALALGVAMRRRRR